MGFLEKIVSIQNRFRGKSDPFFMGKDGIDNFIKSNARKDFLPPIGEVIWEYGKNYTNYFYANICKIENDLKIGYIYFDNYSYDQEALYTFSEIIVQMEENTSVLIIDQRGNKGGSMIQMYGILSMLTNYNLLLPKHEMKIDDDLEYEAVEAIEMIEEESNTANSILSEEIEYFKFILKELKIGRGRKISTLPTYLSGISKIEPATNHYTKKTVVLIDEETFSASEFFASILQDNNRAILFGANTKGGGGCMKRVWMPEMEALGITSFNITYTLAWRPNGLPIENFGVMPDVQYSVKQIDFAEKYVSYLDELKKIVNVILLYTDLE